MPGPVELLDRAISFMRDKEESFVRSWLKGLLLSALLNA